MSCLVKNMGKTKKVFFISECLANQYIRAEGVYNIKGEGPVAGLMEFFVKHGIGMSVVPCPEIAYEGLKRKACGKECYDNPAYRKICSNIAEQVVTRYKLYLDDNYLVGGYICVNGSPSCAIDYCYSDKEGTKKCQGPGILIEELKKCLAANNLTLDFFGFKASELDGLLKKLENVVSSW